MKLAVIGLGSAGARHSRLLGELGHEVIGFDPDAAPEGIERADSLEAAIDAADAVIVASPNSHHNEHARHALEAGKPTLVEKPLATTAGAAQQLAHLAEEHELVAGVAMNLRFHAGVRELKRILEAGELGALKLARISFGYDLRKWRPQTDYRQSYSAQRALGGGIVFDAIHELDYLTWIAGPVTDVTAETATVSNMEIDVEDTALALATLESGAFATIDLNFVEPVYRRGCLLVGEAATAEWDWNTATVSVNRDGADPETTDVTCPVETTYTAELEDFIAAVEGGRAAMTSLAEGVKALELAEAIKTSAAEGRRVSL